jgi:hypothetical protein
MLDYLNDIACTQFKSPNKLLVFTIVISHNYLYIKLFIK